jgi:hypothetical protein
MEPYIEKVKTLIKDTHTQFSNIFSNIKFRASLIGYTDYDKLGNRTKDQIIKLPFTTDSTVLQDFVSNIKAGGGKF